MVAGSCVWFYMLDESSKGEAYCAAVLSGFGASMMFVTSMALAAELVGENKVNTSGRNELANQRPPREQFSQSEAQVLPKVGVNCSYTGV